jgi:pimeloyl-ACP methyl ester carboxylesterase
VATSFSFSSADGTALRGWQGGGDGLPLLICNGLGTVPQAWPGLVEPDSGYRAFTWFHRGTFGSERPADPGRVRIADHVADAVALLDSRGVERALVACWSFGVNVGFELAQRHPDRVAGLMAVAGVPGGTFATMGEPWRVPRRLRHSLATGLARSGRLAGPALTWLAPKVPVGDGLARLLTQTRVMRPQASPERLVPLLRQFLVQDWGWYMHLALAAGEHEPMDLSFVTSPVTLLAGRHDVLTSMGDIVEAAGRMPHAHTTVLPGSHFLPLEFPELVSAALGELARRSDLAPQDG